MKTESMLLSKLAFWSVVAFAFTPYVAAATCPDISGTYISDEGARIKFTQVACQSLTRFIGVRASDGSIVYSTDRVFLLDGTPICNSVNACESAHAGINSIDFTLNFNSGVRTEGHGLCNQNGYSLAKDGQGGLTANFSVYRCADGFKGKALKIFQPD